MASGKPKPELLVIVGPTASGKSGLAMWAAKKFKGEIIAADSLTVYKSMDIGTAKPTKSDRESVRHWAIDIIGPGKRFTAADFKAYAEAKIKDIKERGRLTIVVGGTGLYVDALVYDFSFGNKADDSLRLELEKLSLAELQDMILQAGYRMPRNQQNRRHLTRTIERAGETGSSRHQPIAGAFLVGLMPGASEHKQAISRRVEQMFEDGLVAETTALVSAYGADSVRAKAAVAYGPVIDYLESKLTEQQAKERLKTLHWQYARRQKTWFKRNPDIAWFETAERAKRVIDSVLNT